MTDPELLDKYTFLFNSPSFLTMLLQNIKMGLRQGLSFEFTSKMYFSPLYKRDTLFMDRLLIFLTKILPIFVL
jgi:hypothetical protein